MDGELQAALANLESPEPGTYVAGYLVCRVDKDLHGVPQWCLGYGGLNYLEVLGLLSELPALTGEVGEE